MDMGSVLRAGEGGTTEGLDRRGTENVRNTTRASVEGCLDKAARRLQNQ